MSRATNSVLEMIHGLMAQSMLDRLQDKENPVEAKDWTAISKFLKDNGIDALLAPDSTETDAFASLVQAAQKHIAKTDNTNFN